MSWFPRRREPDPDVLALTTIEVAAQRLASVDLLTREIQRANLAADDQGCRRMARSVLFTRWLIKTGRIGEGAP